MTIAEWCIFRNADALFVDDCIRQRPSAFAASTIPGPAIPPSSRSRSGLARWAPTHNGIEAFPFFAAAVLLAEFRTAPQHLINELAVLFLIVRIAYVFTYLGDRPTLRSILWNLGFAINVAIFFLPAIKGYLPG